MFRPDARADSPAWRWQRPRQRPSSRMRRAARRARSGADPSTRHTETTPASTASGASRGGLPRRLGKGGPTLTDGLDPTGEYLARRVEHLLAACSRACSSATGTPLGRGGTGSSRISRQSVLSPTNGGTTYSFHLKPGTKFGPPLNRPIVSRDLAYAIERLAKPKNGAQYSFDYSAVS